MYVYLFYNHVFRKSKHNNKNNRVEFKISRILEWHALDYKKKSSYL